MQGIKWYHIALIFLVLGFIAGRRVYNGSSVRVIETRTDTITQVVKVDSLIYVTERIELPSTIDTNAVIQAFYSERLVDTTIVVNEAKIKFTGTLLENNLRNVNFSIQNLRPTQIVQEMKYSLSVGGVVGKEIIAPSVMLDIDNHKIGLGYNFLNGGLLVNYHYRIWSR